MIRKGVVSYLCILCHLQKNTLTLQEKKISAWKNRENAKNSLKKPVNLNVINRETALTMSFLKKVTNPESGVIL